MPVYEIQPISLPNGEFAAEWFDDENGLWDNSLLHKPQSLVSIWRTPKLTLVSSKRPTDVLFNPHACAVSAGVRAALVGFSEIEFLPVDIDEETFFVLHVIAFCEAPRSSDMRRAPLPSGNIVELFAFPADYVASTDFFRVLQPKDSAAGLAGYCVSRIYMSASGARAIEASCGRYLWAREVSRDAPLVKRQPILN